MVSIDICNAILYRVASKSFRGEDVSDALTAYMECVTLFKVVEALGVPLTKVIEKTITVEKIIKVYSRVPGPPFIVPGYGGVSFVSLEVMHAEPVSFAREIPWGIEVSVAKTSVPEPNVREIHRLPEPFRVPGYGGKSVLMLEVPQTSFLTVEMYTV